MKRRPRVSARARPGPCAKPLAKPDSDRLSRALILIQITVFSLTNVLFSQLSRGQQESKKPVFPPASERQVLAPSRTSTPTTPSSVDASWSIVIAGVVAEDNPPGTRRAVGLEALQKVQTKGGLSEAYLDPRGGALVIAYGHYAAPSDPEAQRDLERVREIVVDGAKPFADAYLSPPPGDAYKGSIAEYDLRNAGSQFGAKRAKYTLQVGIYGQQDSRAPLPSARELAEIRAAAELAATTLRREGELAFYYHGPVRSTVTVGLFSDQDIDARQPGGECQALRDLRRRQPYNLLNGQGIKEILRAQVDAKGRPMERMQPSQLVAVPD